MFSFLPICPLSGAYQRFDRRQSGAYAAVGVVSWNCFAFVHLLSWLLSDWLSSISVNLEVFVSLGCLVLTLSKAVKLSLLLLRAVLQAVSAVDGLGALVVDTDLLRGVFDRDFTLEQRDQLIALLIFDMSIASALRSLRSTRGRHAHSRLGLPLRLQHRD